jgi:hypothetical protein
MDSAEVMTKWPMQVGIGFVAGAAIATVDNIAFEGEVSPIVIVAMLLAATGTAGAIWGWRGRIAAAAAWVCVPLAHLLKLLLGLPDTLHPNNYASILMLAVFTLVVATIGTGCGVLVRRLTTDAAKGDSKHLSPGTEGHK